MANDSLLLSETAASPASSNRRALPRRRLAFILVAACLLCTLAAEEWLSIGRRSMTFDECAHLYAGYQHWTARDFGVNPNIRRWLSWLPLCRCYP